MDSNILLKIDAQNNNYSTHVSQIAVKLSVGIHKLTMRMFGSTPDGIGVTVNHVAVR